MSSAVLTENSAEPTLVGRAGAVRRNPVGLWLSAAVAAVLLLALLAPNLLTGRDPLGADPMSALLGPSGQHWFGTDQLGRDVFTRVVHGARYSLLIGIASMLISLVVGVLLGVVAGLGNRAVDEVASRVFDVLSAFPGILLAMLVVTLTGPGVANIALAVGIAGIPKFARVVRAQTLQVRHADYVRHAVLHGRSRAWVLLRHVLPNVVVAIPVIATIDIGTSIIAVSGLSFLGLGPQPPTPEWGVMLAEGRGILRTAWWVGVFPGLVITVTVIATTTLGRALQRRWDGRTS